MRLSPRDPYIGFWHVGLGDPELGLGHFDAAIGEYHKAIDAGLHSSIPYQDLAAAYALEGKWKRRSTHLGGGPVASIPNSPKWMRVHARTYRPCSRGLRKAGLPEE